MSSPHVAILSSPGTGHLTPAVELANLLHRHHNLTTTLITYSNFSSPSHASILSSLPPFITSVSLPLIPLASLPADARIETCIAALIAASVPSLATTLQTLKSSTNLIAYVIDLFGVDTIPAARQLNLPAYMLFTSNLFMLSFMFHLPTLHETTTCQFRDLTEPLKLPGCVPLNGADFLDPIQDRNNPAYEWVLHLARGYSDVDGVLANSFQAMEPHVKLPRVFSVGPIWRRSESGSDKDNSECLDWLGRQPRGSVLFVSFGSGGTLSFRQVAELALGLENSGQRFLWVVRTPSDSEANGSFFGIGDSNDPLTFLPQGFVSRTKDLGLVVRNWVPQIDVLSHLSVGGFLSHCGWNSTMESVMNGVPMIAWPLYAEQRMNAVMLVEGMKVALRARESDEGLIVKEEISCVVKELMEGDEGRVVRERVKELKEAGYKALDKRGSSYLALEEVVDKWKSSSAV